MVVCSNMVITCVDFEGIAIASLGSSRFMVTEVFLWDDGPFLSKSSQRFKSGPPKRKWKDTHSKITRTCHNPEDEDEALYKVNGEKVLSTAESHDKKNSSYTGDNSAFFTRGANGVSKEKNKDDITMNVAVNAGCDKIVNSNVCDDWRIAPASYSGISAGSHLTGAGVDNCGIEHVESFFTNGSLEFSQIACKDYECETDESESTPMSSEGKEHLAIGECTEPDDSEALKPAEECGTDTILPEKTLIDENFEGKQCDEHSAGIGVAVGSEVSDITEHSNDQSHDHSDVYLDRSSCSSGDSCSSISNTAEHNISYNERCILATSEINSAHSENIADDVSGLDTKSEPVISKEKYKVKRQRPEKFNDESREMPEEYSATIKKYWRQRYILFSKFDDGIRMDEEGWFSVTPEVIARYQAERCARGTIIDCFTGVGGNAIQFAQWGSNVIAIDIDPLKIEYARHNAAIYGVENNIEFIVGDSFLLAPTLKADTVFLSPPWGGPDYNKAKTYDMKTMLRPHDGHTLFNAAKKIAPRVVMFLPKNVNFNQLAELALSARPPWSLEVEKVYLNGRLKAITAYFSDPLLPRLQRMT